MEKSDGKEETKVGSKDTIHPLDDRVLIEGLSDDELNIRSASGIIIPETVNKEKPMQGRVVSVGPGRYTEDGKRVPMQVKAGDRVVFSKYSPDEIKIDGKEYFILNESSILAVIK
jgi:chaperonin GroES